MSQDIVNLKAFNVQRVPDPELSPDDSLAGGIGTSYAIVGYKGKMWTLRYRGETHPFKQKVTREDGTVVETFADHIDIVVLWAAPGKSKSYFPNWEDGSGEPPLCASLDGVVPDVGVEQKQSEACAICPRNEWKTLPNGRKGRECTDYKRLAIACMPNATKLMFGEPLMEPIFLRVPPASLNSLALLEQKMGPKGMGYHYAEYLTRITFVPEQSYPQMQFYAVRPLTEAEKTPIKNLRNDPQCQRITGEAGTARSSRVIMGPTTQATDFHRRLSTHCPAPNQPSPAMAAPPPAQSATTPLPEEEMGFGLSTVTPASISKEEPLAENQYMDADGTVQFKPTAPTQLVAPQQAGTDTGEPEESDAELDARIAGIISKAK